MPNILRRADLDFWLYDWLNVEELCDSEVFSDHSREVFDQILDTAERVAEDVLYPWAKGSDIEEPEFDDGKAIIPQQTKVCLDALIENGFSAGGFPPEYGGLGLPYTVSRSYAAMFAAANGGIDAYLMLTAAAANLLLAHGSKEQIETFVPNMVAGKWFGTMNLSEPQAGSSLGDIRMRAEPQDDGTYRLFGTKMWISGGEHELSDNIIHLVLGKIPGSAPGVKGISLFIVPRRLIDENGESGERNDVHLAGVNHKMGNRATINTVLNYGETDGAVGYLLGEPGKGLAYMFHMMNEARIGVGMGAAALACTGYLHALDYAKDRPQGRVVGDKAPTQPMVPIIRHGDVRRMLMQQKAYAEGAMALCLYGAYLIDKERLAEGDEKQRLHLLLEILTPIMKSWPSEFGVRANDQAIQVHGGYGYTREYPVERFYRDNRLNPIHEGTKGIQGLDLLGRKVKMQGGAAMMVLDKEIAGTIALAKEAGEDELADQLAHYWSLIKDTTRKMGEGAAKKGAEAYTANATLYLDAFGHVIVAWIWLSQVLALKGEGAFETGKRQAAQYFFRYELSTITPVCELLTTLDTTCLDLDDTAF